MPTWLSALDCSWMKAYVNVRLVVVAACVAAATGTSIFLGGSAIRKTSHSCSNVRDRAATAGCLYCYENRKGRASHKGHRYYRGFTKKTYYTGDPTMKRPAETTAPGGAAPSATDDRFLKLYPTLHTYMTDTTWEDGTSREVSSLSVFVEDGRWKIAINDKDLRRSVYVTGGTFLEAMQAAEKAVASSGCDWRAWNKATKKR